MSAGDAVATEHDARLGGYLRPDHAGLGRQLTGIGGWTHIRPLLVPWSRHR